MKGVNLRLDAGISTREEETARITGGSYHSKVAQRKDEAAIEKEIAEITEPPQAEPATETNKDV
jgi:hypothetical protein